MQLQTNFNFSNSVRQLWDKANSGSAALNAHVRNTGGTVYGLAGPTAAPRANGNYQRYLQYKSDSAAAAGMPNISESSPGSSVPSGPSGPSAPSGPASNSWDTYAYLDNGSIGASSAKSWDYLNADLAKQYGMSRETAYQEALSNTGYQRSVADMQAAGLNPAAIFGAGSGYQASGVGYVSADSPSGGGSGYIAQVGVSRRGTSGKSQTDYNLTGKQYALIQLLGAGVGALSTHSWAGALSGAAIGRYVAQYLGNK